METTSHHSRIEPEKDGALWDHTFSLRHDPFSAANASQAGILDVRAHRLVFAFLANLCIAAISQSDGMDYKGDRLLFSTNPILTKYLSAKKVACPLYGPDPLHVANEGILTVVVDPSQADALLDVMTNHPLAPQTSIIGKVGTEKDGKVLLNTLAGGTRILDLLTGEQLPRIC